MLFVHSLVDKHLGFHFFTVINIMSICVQVFGWTYVFISLVYLGVELLHNVVTMGFEELPDLQSG